MSSHIPPVFQALPVEVLDIILRQMASLEDLYATIRASRKAFGSFLCFREAILIEVLQAHLPAEIFAEYLGLLHIPKYEDFNHVPNRSDLENPRVTLIGPGDPLFAWENSRFRAWQTVFEAFFVAHFENVRTAKLTGVQRYSVPKSVDKDQINYIISMHCTLRRFIRDYQSFTQSILTGNPPPLSNLDLSFRRQEFSHEIPNYTLCPPFDLKIFSPETEDCQWPPLTENEAIRLQRGFLRYELCSRLNAIPAWQTSIMQCDDNSYLMGLGGGCVLGFNSSLSKFLQRWEEEEIMCVWVYVDRQYKVLVQKILDEYRSDIRRLSRKARGVPDGEISLPPDINTELTGMDLFDRWTYNMSCLGLPILQQVLRSSFGDQRRFLKNTSFATMPELGGSLFLRDATENHVGDEWSSPPPMVRPFRNLPTTNGASSTFVPVAKKLANWRMWDYERRKGALVIERVLQETGWVFWEDDRRLQCLGWPASRNYSEDHAHHFLGDLYDRTWKMKFGVEKKYSEASMYIAEKDILGELSAMYAVNPPEPGAEYFVLDRLRAISDWSSKEVSPAFQEICSGMPKSG